MKSSTLACTFVLLGSSLGSRSMDAHPKTDVVVLANGDRITCEIKGLERGRLTVKTDAFGTVAIKWDHVARIESRYVYRLELQSGDRHVGTMEPSDEDGKRVGRDAGGR